MKSIALIIAICMLFINGCSSFAAHEELKSPCADNKVASLSIDCDEREPVNVAGL